MSGMDNSASNLVIDQSKHEAIEKVLTIEDTLLEILKNLDAKTIKTAALVCKRWNEVISSSQVLMKGLKLITHWMTKDEKSTRKYLDVKITHCRDSECQIFDFCYETSQIRYLYVEVRDDTMLSWSKFSVLLTNMPNLESLEIYLVRSSLSYESSMKIVLPNLKRLVLQTYQSRMRILILDFFDAEKLTELAVFRCNYTDADRDIYINFLKKARNLKTWTLYRYDLDLFENVEKFPFQLTTLDIEHFYGNIINRDNFEKFLIDQISMIKEILIDYRDELVYQLVLTSQVCIEQLTIRATDIFRDNNFYTELKPLNSLRTLMIDDLERHEKFLSKCPNLEEIYCDDKISKDNLNLIATHLKLKHLKFRFKGKLALLPSEITFKCLTSLAIESGDIESIYGIVQCCPMLKVLDLQKKLWKKSKELDSFVDKILRNTNVQHLKLRMDIDGLKKLFVELNSDYGDSRKLGLTLKVWNQQSMIVPKDTMVKDTLGFPSFRSYKLEELYEKRMTELKSLNEKVV